MDDHHSSYITKLEKKKTKAANKQSNATNKVINQPTYQPNKGIWKKKLKSKLPDFYDEFQ
jgi:hypothetical protein